ncbi:MAG: right-handed parallel beta-helix repeat-containing protein [Desulfobulbaceae bacterium]|nr:right-handed parallel beta-helix repeat-containing protein [Desulfobulbaceae bacterium]
MAISALEHFGPLASDQIVTLIAQRGQRPPEITEEISPLFINNGNLSQQKNFSLTIDEAFLEKYPFIHITECNHFTIRSSMRLKTPPHNNKFFIEITNCAHFSIEGIGCSFGRNMLFIADSSYFVIENCRCSNAEGSGIIIHNGCNFNISECFFDNNLSACILVIGHSYNGEIKDCTLSRSRGFFNHDAGIHLCCTSPNVTLEHIPEEIHEPLPITDKTQRPHHILIKNCTITHCRAQGIYLEGAVNCLIEDNILLNNNKEGICFDWGSSYNIFCRNIVSLNGERKKLSPQEIEIDFISEYPLLADGSSSMKLPGISLDNGCMNLLDGNLVSCNYGGGIKMIRTSLFNVFTGNRILYNAIGVNEFVPYFHAITLLGMGAKKEFIKKDRPLLDFMPSIMNTINRNTITEPLQAIFYDKVSSNNFVSENKISVPGRKNAGPAAFFFRARAYLKRFFHRLSPLPGHRPPHDHG